MGVVTKLVNIFLRQDDSGPVVSDETKSIAGLGQDIVSTIPSKWQLTRLLKPSADQILRVGLIPFPCLGIRQLERPFTVH